MTQQPRNLFATSTFWSIAILLTQACWQPVSDIITEGVTSERLQVVALAALTSMYGITQRLSKDESIYTPDFLPGRNKNQTVTTDTTSIVQEIVKDVVKENIDQVIKIPTVIKNKIISPD